VTTDEHKIEKKKEIDSALRKQALEERAQARLQKRMWARAMRAFFSPATLFLLPSSLPTLDVDVSTSFLLKYFKQRQLLLRLILHSALELLK
jgi:hypothetical protein